MKHKIYFTLALMLSLGSFERALACSCWETSPCYKYQNADVVFVGKVVEIKKEFENAFSVYFEVREAFKEAAVGEKKKILAESNTSCAFHFNQNEIYLVHARNVKNEEGIFGSWTGQCSGTSQIESAEESIKLLRKILSKSSGYIIVGKIEYTSGKSHQSLPFEGVKLKAQQINNKNRVFYGTTDKNGFYEIKVPIGTYSVTPELPKNYIIGVLDKNGSQPIKVGKQQCNGKFFVVVKPIE